TVEVRVLDSLRVEIRAHQLEELDELAEDERAPTGRDDLAHELPEREQLRGVLRRMPWIDEPRIARHLAQAQQHREDEHLVGAEALLADAPPEVLARGEGESRVRPALDGRELDDDVALDLGRQVLLDLGLQATEDERTDALAQREALGRAVDVGSR